MHQPQLPTLKSYTTRGRQQVRNNIAKMGRKDELRDTLSNFTLLLHVFEEPGETCYGGCNPSPSHRRTRVQLCFSNVNVNLFMFFRGPVQLEPIVHQQKSKAPYALDVIARFRVRAFFHKIIGVCHVYCHFKLGYTCQSTQIQKTERLKSLE